MPIDRLLVLFDEQENLSAVKADLLLLPQEKVPKKLKFLDIKAKDIAENIKKHAPDVCLIAFAGTCEKKTSKIINGTGLKEKMVYVGGNTKNPFTKVPYYLQISELFANNQN